MYTDDDRNRVDRLNGEIAQSRGAARLRAARVAIDAMPAWFRDRLSSAGMSLCDWGCAEGDGTAEFAASLGVVASGADDSIEAVGIAARRHPTINFLVTEVVEQSIEFRFDVMFSTGVLNRSQAHWPAFGKLAALASRYVVVLLEDHGVAASPAGIDDMLGVPVSEDGFVLAHAATIDVAPGTGAVDASGYRLCIYAHPSEVEPVLDALGSRHSKPLPEHDLSKLQRDAADLERIRASRAWRWSVPLRFAARVLSGRTTPKQAIVRVRSAASRTLMRWPIGNLAKRKLYFRAHSDSFANADARATDIPLDLLRPVPAQPGKHDVFVWSVIDWHFRIQRPQHLSRALAQRGHRVFYISNTFIDSTEPGFGIESLDGDARLFQVRLHVGGAPSIYVAMPTALQLQELEASLLAFMAWAQASTSISLVQHPYWSEVSKVPRSVQRVFDCMDHHAGFSDNAPAIIAAERALVRCADLVVVSSAWLENEMRGHARRLALIRNAADHAFFAKAPRTVFRDRERRKVVGYYGAIGAWFDVELVARVARALPNALVLLIGQDTAGAAARLADLPNVRVEGEVPYRDLPYWLHAFDVCLLPFRVNALTLATNPVKIYEYLSAGKQVVAVDLPEMVQFKGLVHVAADGDSFVRAVQDVLADPAAAPSVEAMTAFAASQTWDERAGALETALAAIAGPDEARTEALSGRA